MGAVLIVLAVGRADAQTATPAQPAASGVTVRWNNGLHVETEGGDNVFQIGTLIQGDGRFATVDPPSLPSTFLIRRGRIMLQGRVARLVDFYFVPEFAGTTPSLLDAYADTRIGSGFRFRIGKFKSPIGLEHLYSDAALPFAERSIATNLSPNRDVGVTAIGDVWSRRVTITGGVMNGVADGTSGDLDVNTGKDVVGRVVAMAGPIGLAIAGSHGQTGGSLSGYRSASTQVFFSYASGVTADGFRTRVTPSVFLYRGPFGAYAEYFRNTQRVTGGDVTADLTHTAWNATFIVVLTGEASSDRGATPREPINPAEGRWGAFQLAVRASGLTVDPDTFSLGLAAAGASRTARAAGIGFVWYLNGVVKHMFTYERTVFGGTTGPQRRTENAVIYRVQINLAPRL